jgi:hypothetical protein
MMSKKLKLMADYGGTVLWGVDAADVGAIDPGILPLTDGLKAAIRAWADAYDRTLNQDYPPVSGFADQAEQETFEQEGMRLWRQLQAQLGPDWSVAYYSDRDGKLYQ